MGEPPDVSTYALHGSYVLKVCWYLHFVCTKIGFRVRARLPIVCVPGVVGVAGDTDRGTLLPGWPADLLEEDGLDERERRRLGVRLCDFRRRCGGC